MGSRTRSSRPARSNARVSQRDRARRAPRRRRLVVVATLLLASVASARDDISIEVDCPATAAPGATPALVANVENRSCDPLTVRLMSTVVGNAGGSLESISISGPEVVVASAVVPAATLGSSTCNFGACTNIPGFVRCDVDADCACADGDPGTAALPYDLADSIPLAVADTVIEQFTFLDVPGTADQSDATCLIAVPEPTASSTLWLGAALLAGGRRVRARLGLISTPTGDPER